ncbi:hypothetical protein AN477_05900 [Alicyclobacillus ferrooxydans]|uniref:DUF3445 domain-containing protein n=1 Tax=Alicyclobacillus ferrooxydans TaxID=471514 RepID=A0A0P9EME8_9BACL|nr:hypothetical protein AN477_05900 [Alicyclobacillus ferrooxydans]
MTVLSSRFPFPLSADIFQYSNNLRPLDTNVSIQVTHEYTEEVGLKRSLLKQHPERCFREEIHTRDAQWEVLNYVLHQLSQVYPEHFRLRQEGDNWIFENTLLGEEVHFRDLDNDSLSCAPLDFAGRQVQEDLILLTQYDDKLVLEAGQLCFPGNWSLYFDFGMPFMDIHTPVPGLIDDGLAAKIERFLMRVESGKPWTRLNWSLNAGRRLDTSAETFDEWGPYRYRVTEDNVGHLVHLRVEEQNLMRMPRSNSLLFTIHTYLMPLHEITQNQTWTNRLYRVLCTLSPKLVEYKGLSAYRDVVVEYLAKELRVNT